MIVATRPDPTVRPPSRIANVRPCSIAIGWIAKKIEEDYCYLKKEPRKGRMYYALSDLGREYLDSITP